MYDANNAYLDNRVYNSPEEFKVIVGMLRDEKPFWFDPSTKHLRTNFGLMGVPTGKEETLPSYIIYNETKVFSGQARCQISLLPVLFLIRYNLGLVIY